MAYTIFDSMKNSDVLECIKTLGDHWEREKFLDLMEGMKKFWIDYISIELSAEKLDFVSQYLSIHTERVAAYNSVEIKDTGAVCIEMKSDESEGEEKIRVLLSSGSVDILKGEKAKDEQAAME
jgi:hypothetical protein